MWEDYFYDRTKPQSSTTRVLANQFIATGYLRVYNISVFSSNAASQFVLMFDATTLPADGAVPIMAFPITASGNLGLYYGSLGRLFQRGLVLCTSSTSTTKTVNATSDCLWDVEYDQIPPVYAPVLENS